MEDVKLPELSIDELNYISAGITLLVKAYFDQDEQIRHNTSKVETECISFVLRFQRDIQLVLLYQNPDSQL